MGPDTLRLIAATSALVALAGCGRDQPEGTRLTVTVTGAPDGQAASLAAEATGRTLIAQGSGGDLLPGLASSWRFVDGGRSLILRLKPERWSDTKPLEARQVVASLRKAASRGDAAMLATGIAEADTIAAGNAPLSKLGALAPITRVVELRLDAASPLLLGWLAEPGLATTRTSAGKSVTLAPYVGEGPPSRRVLKRRTMAAGPDARPAEIIINANPDISTAIAAFTAGKADIVIGDGLAGLGEARATPPREAFRLDSLWGVYGLRANTRQGPLADPQIRRALAFAIDRPALAASFGLAAIEPAEGLVPPALGLVSVPPRSGVAARIAKTSGRKLPDEPNLLPSVPAAGLDTATRFAEARRLLAEAGWNAEAPLRLVLLIPLARDHQRVAEAVAADWAGVGVQLTVRALPPAALAERAASGDYDLLVDESSVPVPDAGALLARYRCGNGIICNPTADALLDDARRAGPAARPILLARAEAEWMAAPPVIPLFTPVRWALVSRKVDGWLPNRAGRHPLGRLAVK